MREITTDKIYRRPMIIKFFIIVALALSIFVGIAGASPYAYITNDNDYHGTVTVIDTATDACIKTIDVGTAPLGVAVNPEGTKAYVVNWGSGTVSVIDTTTNTVSNTVNNVGHGSWGIAINPDGTKAYVTDTGDNTLTIIDTTTNTVIKKVPVGSTPEGVVVNPTGTKVYVANTGGNTVSIIDVATDSVTNVPVGNNPYGVAINPDGKKAYVGNSGGTVSVIDTATNTVTSTVNVGLQPWGIAVNPAGTRIYVANFYSNNVSIIDTATNKVVKTVLVGNHPHGVAFNPIGTKAYVVQEDGNVSIINTATYAVSQIAIMGAYNPCAFGQFIVPPPAPNVLPVANFSSNVRFGSVPLTVQFTSLSKNATSWSWNFGDGSNSTQMNPTHIYNKAGQFTVILTVKNAAGSDAQTRIKFINVVDSLEPPVTAFSASPLSGKVPLTVSFTDQSTGSITSWKWLFGDGNTSTTPSPTFTYNKVGKYTVSLTTSNAAGSDILTKTSYINVTS